MLVALYALWPLLSMAITLIPIFGIIFIERVNQLCLAELPAIVFILLSSVKLNSIRVVRFAEQESSILENSQVRRLVLKKGSTLLLNSLLSKRYKAS